MLEGPEPLAQKFAEMLEQQRKLAAARRAASGAAPAKTPPDVEAAPPQEVTPPPEAEQKAPPVRMLVLRNARQLERVDADQPLERLVLSGDQITNRSLKGLAGLRITMLSIEALNVSNAGMQYVQQVQGVQRLRLWSPAVDDSSLSFIAALEGLEVLDLEGTAISGAGVAQLKGLTKLHWLILGPRVSDGTLLELQPLKTLRQLDLRACDELSEEGLEILAKLKDLEVVWLPEHLRMHGAGLLRVALPDCEVRS